MLVTAGCPHSTERPEWLLRLPQRRRTLDLREEEKEESSLQEIEIEEMSEQEGQRVRLEMKISIKRC